MVKSELKIALKQSNNQPVSLKALSPQALESFLIVVSSFKAIALNLVPDEELSFVISEGSAACAIVAPDAYKESIYEELNTAIIGECEDKDITRNLRTIQDQIKRSNLDYVFQYRAADSKNKVFLHERLERATRISSKRRRQPFTVRIKTISGFLNLIGGKNPNYHFDYGGGQSLTIDCTMEEAKEVNKYLYKNITTLVQCKEWEREEKKDEYYHVALLDEDINIKLRKYFKAYYKESNLIEKLSMTYDFVDGVFRNSNLGHQT